MANKLIFCFDGTFHSSNTSRQYVDDESITNVLKLHILLGGQLINSTNAAVDSQRSFYYSGIGTYGGWLRRMWNVAFSPSSLDEKHILQEARKDLEEHYQRGTEIFVFGFSRGAAVGRIFAAELKQPVKFIGLFETVATSMISFGQQEDEQNSANVPFRNCTLGDHVERAVHLTAIDEQRTLLKPTLFNQDPRVSEVWFAGVHGDIGGGYWFDGLSDVTLEFMRKEAMLFGLKFLSAKKVNYEALAAQNPGDEDEEITHDDVAINPIVNGTLHEQHRGMLSVGDIILAPRVLAVNRKDAPSTLERDVPVIHHSVRERFYSASSYRPVALRNQRYRIMNPEGEVENELRLGVEGLRWY